MARIKKQGDKRVWVSWLSLESANHIADWANVIFVVSLVAGVISTIFIMGTTNVKEWYWEKDRTESRERVAAAELKTEQLRKQMGPRIIDRAIFSAAISQQPKARVEIWYLRDDSESFTLALQIQNNLLSAGWFADTPKPIRVSGESDRPAILVVGGWHNGVIVVTRSIQPDDQANSILFNDEDKKTAYAGLTNALLRTVGAIVGREDKGLPEGTVRVIVGPKP
jgi:hypothetical protein